MTSSARSSAGAGAGRLQTALDHYRAGRLQQAETLCAQVLPQDPRDAQVLHLLGVLATQPGNRECAAELIARATRIRGTEPMHLERGKALKRQGKPEAAWTFIATRWNCGPGLAPVHNNLGRILQQQGRTEAAVGSTPGASRSTSRMASNRCGGFSRHP